MIGKKTEKQLREIVRKWEKDIGYFDFSEDKTFIEFHDAIWEFFKTGQTDDEKKYSRFYQLIDEGDFESHERAYLKWLNTRIQNGKGKYVKYASIKDALNSIVIMLDEDDK